jgi:hypothetical protein
MLSRLPHLYFPKLQDDLSDLFNQREAGTMSRRKRLGTEPG